MWYVKLGLCLATNQQCLLLKNSWAALSAALQASADPLSVYVTFPRDQPYEARKDSVQACVLLLL